NCRSWGEGARARVEKAALEGGALHVRRPALSAPAGAVDTRERVTVEVSLAPDPRRSTGELLSAAHLAARRLLEQAAAILPASGESEDDPPEG
ncbi:MAG TPA: hypothetical protein DHW63_05960, partial [Hyphomonadaceae bacterium]|nr:hypothetical protein [Hyphomonadaceae bacterium]